MNGHTECNIINALFHPPLKAQTLARPASLLWSVDSQESTANIWTVLIISRCLLHSYHFYSNGRKFSFLNLAEFLTMYNLALISDHPVLFNKCSFKWKSPNQRCLVIDTVQSFCNCMSYMHSKKSFEIKYVEILVVEFEYKKINWLELVKFKTLNCKIIIKCIILLFLYPWTQYQVFILYTFQSHTLPILHFEPFKTSEC